MVRLPCRPAPLAACPSSLVLRRGGRLPFSPPMVAPPLALLRALQAKDEGSEDEDVPMEDI